MSQPLDNDIKFLTGVGEARANLLRTELGIRTVGEFPNLTETLLKRGHPERVVRKIMGENWVNVLKDVWGE